MIEVLKELFKPYELFKGKYGVERETLRVDINGKLSDRPHPEGFGDKIKNKYITVDFSESQIEMITPPLDTIEEVYNFLEVLYDIVSIEIKDEYLWPQSMPGLIDENIEIPIGVYDDSNEGKKAREYRCNLIKKYGGKNQLICGIHYNFSFDENIIMKMYDSKKVNINSKIDSKKELSYKEFKNEIYLKIVRNFLRYRWLLIYLQGSSVDADINSTKEKNNDDIISYRNSEYGYRNKENLFPNYDSIYEYVGSLKSFINDKVINSYKELYSSIRPKAKDEKNFLKSLENDGINYLEIRSIDVNPFEKVGISLNELYFIQFFNLFLLIEDEEEYDLWQQEALENADKVSLFGLNNITLKKNGTEISRENYALEILNKMSTINDALNLGKHEVLKEMYDKVYDYKNTNAYKIKKDIEASGYVNAHLNLSKKYKKEAYEKRFNFRGFEDLELSTQILMKEAIKKGISVEVIDRYENFIALKYEGKTEYVKQATKTSKDNYVTVLIMENKSVTKKVLKNNNVRVPEGFEFHSMDEAMNNLNKLINKPIVIKPKSTNYGIGISIFSEGTNKENIMEALKIAFSNDNTVLVEKFIKGKEFRFLIIDDEVAGILYRVPANIRGDGVRNITELVNEKNKDSLRGYKYRTPLEKIKLGEIEKNYLNTQNKDFNYVPNKDEIIYLRENSNISTGGDSIDFTDDILDKYKKIAIEAAKKVGAKICGVDMIIEDYENENSSYGIIELNFNPAIHIHCYPYIGKERNIGEKILKLLEFI